MRLPEKPLLLEVNQRARDCHGRLLAKVHIIPSQCKGFRDSKPSRQHHIDDIEQITPPSRSSVTYPVLPCAQPFTKRPDLIDSDSLRRASSASKEDAHLAPDSTGQRRDEPQA